MASHKVKLVSDGFMEDAAKLLSEFAKRKSTEFKEFAEVWKNNNFALIFMGRPGGKESTVFIDEAFRSSTRFLLAQSFYEKVGAVYLLYSLFQSKPSPPHPVGERNTKKEISKVRIEERHWEEIKFLFTRASEEKYLSLHYVINYLVKEALVFAEHQASRGPWMYQRQMTSLCEAVQFDEIERLKATLFSDLHDYQASRPFEKMSNMWSEYLEMKATLQHELPGIDMYDPTASYMEISKQIDQLLNPEPHNIEIEQPDIGQTRGRLKAKAFESKAKDKFEVKEEYNNDSECELVEEEKNKEENQCKKRIPKEERKVGRPRKRPVEKVSEPKSSDDDFDLSKVDLSELYVHSKNLYLPILPNDDIKKSCTRRQYYKPSSAKATLASSDSDDD